MLIGANLTCNCQFWHVNDRDESHRNKKSSWLPKESLSYNILYCQWSSRKKSECIDEFCGDNVHTFQFKTAVSQRMITLAQHFSFQIIIITKDGFTIKRYVFEPFRFKFHKKLHYILWPIDMTRICHILTFPVPSCRPTQIFMVRNGWYRCPAYRTTCFMLDPHL